LELNEAETTTFDKSIDEKYENYDFQNDLEHFQGTKKFALRSTRPYEIVKQPRILEDIEYYEFMR